MNNEFNLVKEKVVEVLKPYKDGELFRSSLFNVKLPRFSLYFDSTVNMITQDILNCRVNCKNYVNAITPVKLSTMTYWTEALGLPNTIILLLMSLV